MRATSRRNLREHIAREAARIMVEGGIKDYQLGKRKAVERLGADRRRDLPGNDEVEAAVLEYQRLFRADRQPQRLRELRLAAARAMRLLGEFHPRLVGSVLRGTADENSDVCLHLFSDPPEAVPAFLRAQDIRYVLGERRLRVAAEHYRRFPTYRFTSEGVSIELVVFDLASRAHAPLSPIDGKPMLRASLSRVEALMTEALGD